MGRETACGIPRSRRVPAGQSSHQGCRYLFASPASPRHPTGTVKTAPPFLLQNSPTSPGCRAEFGTFFGSWHSWRPSTHALARAAKRLAAQPRQPGRTIVCLDLAQQRSSRATPINRAGSGAATRAVPRGSALFTALRDAARKPKSQTASAFKALYSISKWPINYTPVTSRSSSIQSL